MTQAKVKFTTFEDYLSYSDQTLMEGRYELIDGALIELSPESELNIWIADNLGFSGNFMVEPLSIIIK